MCLLLVRPGLSSETAETKSFSVPKIELVGPDEGFRYPYILRHVRPSLEATPYLIVEPNNTGSVSDDLEVHTAAAKSLALGPSVGSFVANYLNAPLLVPVFPRSETDWQIYTHALDRDSMLVTDDDAQRLDLQLIAMIEHARKRLSNDGLSVPEKTLMNGFSASGTFVNRFTALHPEHVHAVAAGGVNGLAILPFSKRDGQELNFPLGVGDLQQLTGRSFQKAHWKRVPQFLYMGENDMNDAVEFDDGYSEAERQTVYQVLGKRMQPDRWQATQTLYRVAGANAIFKTYEGFGHGTNGALNTEVAEFFRSTLPNSQ